MRGDQLEDVAHSAMTVSFRTRADLGALQNSQIPKRSAVRGMRGELHVYITSNSPNVYRSGAACGVGNTATKRRRLFADVDRGDEETTIAPFRRHATQR
jgi:hypothetical protein